MGSWWGDPMYFIIIWVIGRPVFTLGVESKLNLLLCGNQFVGVLCIVRVVFALMTFGVNKYIYIYIYIYSNIRMICVYVCMGVYIGGISDQTTLLLLYMRTSLSPYIYIYIYIYT
jgi:hypothetical protein